MRTIVDDRRNQARSEDVADRARRIHGTSKWRWLLGGLLALAATSWSAGCKSGESPSSKSKAVAKTLAEARALTDAFQTKLKGELTGAIESGGPAAAIEVCHERAPQIASEVLEQAHKSTWTLRRTAKRVRNPDNAPTPWQTRGLGVLEQALAEAPTPEQPIEWHEVTDGGEVHYMRAIPMGGLCLTCHGDPATLAPEVRTQLTALYPNDEAIGFKVGELRGAFVVTVPSAPPA